MRIFLASPSDATNYREAAQRVAERLNQQHGSKLGTPFFLDVVDWNGHIAPHLGLPESAILEEIAVDENDIFLGIAWLGFDSVHQGEGNQGSGALGASTERNFEIAFNYGGAWSDRPSDAAGDWVPRAVRLTASHPRFGRVEQLFLTGLAR